MELFGWGRFPRCITEVVTPPVPGDVSRFQAKHDQFIARGNGRAYGDAAIGERFTLSTLGLDRMIAFTPQTGALRVESGVLLADVLATFVPRGFFPPVVPGTKFVTVGGMIAADVHGKNHHRAGGFGDHIDELKIVTPAGEIVTCSRIKNAELFAGTVGGMGLTGTIIEATFRLRPIETGWMRQETLVANDLDSAMAALDAAADATYSVAWIDCLARGSSLGRSLVYLAEHATHADLATLRPGDEPYPAARLERLAVPFDLPTYAMNRFVIAALNALYFRRGAARAGHPFLADWNSYFFPLDSIGEWNRIYGRRGFLQHQCVIPSQSARPILAEILDRVSRQGNVSFLAVLKQLGCSRGFISFPLEGYTLALDFCVTDGIFKFLDEIDRLIIDAGGRLYLAKDARQSRDTFEAGYPNLPAFRALRRALSAHDRVTSRLSSRLGI